MRRVLVLHYTPHPAAARLTTQQHLEAIERVADAEVLSYNAVHGAPTWLRRLRPAVVVLHTTLLCMRWNPWFRHWKRRLEWLGELDALKVAFPQDEYDHAHVLDEWLDELGVSVVCTVLDERHRGELYPRLSGRATFREVLTGYIDEQTAERLRPSLRPHAERPHDVVYRARNLPYWFGWNGQLKHRIGNEVLARAPAHGLACDISTQPQETFLGTTWLEFLASGRATIGSESGSSALDRRGELRAQIEELLRVDPSLAFDQVSRLLPVGWDDYRFFAVSPRHLEAVTTKTAQILIEGHYSGVLEPERHYIPVRSDFSNLDEALERALDAEELARIADRAYEDVYASGRYTYQRLTSTLEQIIDDHAPSRSARSGPAFRAARRAAGLEAELERIVVAPVANVARVGRAGVREMVAGLRLAATDPPLRRLLVDYLRSTETREHVSPRQALSDVLCLGALRRARRGKSDGTAPYAVSTSFDREQRRVVLRSHPTGGAAPPREPGVSAQELRALLRSSPVQFAWDHSEVASSVAVPLAGSHRLELPLEAGPHRLPTLDWLARRRPDEVTDALAPIVGRAR